MQLRYNLFKLDNALTFQVVKQSPALTAYLRGIGEFKASNGWTVKSNYYPGIDMHSSTIYLRGTNDMLDTAPDSVFGITNQFRDELTATVYTALQELLQEAIGEDNQIEYPTFSTSEFTPISYGHTPCSVKLIEL